MTKRILYNGNLAQIIEYDDEPGFVYKIATNQTAAAFLQNERDAYDVIQRLSHDGAQASDGILAVDTQANERTSGKPAIKIPKINWEQTLEGFLCRELRIAKGDEGERETQFVQISSSLKNQTYTPEAIMHRFCIFTALLDRSDAFDGQLSQNDFDPSNIIVFQTNDTLDVRLFDFNCAITNNTEKETLGEIGHFKDLTGIPREKLKEKSYSVANRIISNNKWAHPTMSKDGALEEILAPGTERDTPKVTSLDILHHNDLYQAAGLLYWSFTGRTLSSLGETVSLATILPVGQKGLAEKADALIAEAKKRLGSYDKEQVATLRTEIKEIISTYQRTQREKRSAVLAHIVTSPSGLEKRLRLLQDSLRSTIPVTMTSVPQQPYPDGSFALGETLKTYQVGLEERAHALQAQVIELSTQVSNLSKTNTAHKKNYDILSQRYNQFKSLTTKVVIGTVVGVAVTAATLCGGFYFYQEQETKENALEVAVVCPEERVQTVCSDTLLLEKYCADFPSHEACVQSMVEVPTIPEPCLANDYASRLDACVAELDGYKTAGDKEVVYIMKDSPKTIAALQNLEEEIVLERKKQEYLGNDLVRTSSERDGYKAKYEATQRAVAKQWEQCEVAAKAAPHYYELFKDKTPEFCQMMDGYLRTRGIAYQEQVDEIADSLKDNDSTRFYNYAQSCSGYAKLPHDPTGPWNKKPQRK